MRTITMKDGTAIYFKDGGVWMGVFASGAFVQFVSSVKATVVHSDEGRSFYLFSGLGL